jgi:predicted dehydrogenase
MEAGKDVYCEKPMCHTIPQARDLLATQRRTGRVVQIGPQSTSDDVYEKVAAEVAKGTLGPLVLVTSSYARNGTAGEWRDFGLRLPGGVAGVDMNARPGPDLDWDMWLGWKWDLAPKREWQPARFFQFRCYWDYSGGIASDLFFHQLAHLLKATNLRFPERATGNGGIYVFGPRHTTPQGWADDREVPDTYATTIDYGGGPTIVMASSMCNDRGVAEEIRGHLGTVLFTDDGAVIQPQGINPNKEAIHIKRTRDGSSEAHWENFLECVRNRTPDKCSCPVDLGYRTNVAINMGVLSYRQQKTFRWDNRREEAAPA